MRIAVLILTLVLGTIMFFQTFLVASLSGVVGDEATSGAGAIGLLMALLWLVAAALVIPLPLISSIIFVIAGLLGFAVSANFPDLGMWGGASLILAVLSFFGWRGKRRQDLRDRIDREERQELLRQVAAMNQGQGGRPGTGGPS